MDEPLPSKYHPCETETSGVWESSACFARVVSCEYSIGDVACSTSNNELSSYSDAIDLLYSLPTFSFQNQNVETFLAFIGATLQHRRDQIRYLDLRWLSQPKSEVGPQTPEYKLNVKWSYRRISNIKALSELPDGKNFETDCAFVLPGWVIEDILESMKGLKKGGVNWGCESTGCFAQAS